MDKPRVRSSADFHTGFDDGLEPLAPLDIAACRDADEMLRAMGKTAFGARRMGDAAEVLYTMVRDPQCTVVLTLSGAMTVAKMSLLVCEMIDRGMVQAVVSTGALLCHGLVESVGMTHFKYQDGMDDASLYKAGYARVYDTLELETNLTKASRSLAKILDGVPRDTVLSSRRINTLIGEFLDGRIEDRGILKSAFQKKVPVFVPAFTDSELGLDLALYNNGQKRKGAPPLSFDPFLDLEEFRTLVQHAGKIGIFTIGGGVPRNWAQQVSPYLEMLEQLQHIEGGYKRYTYGVRICPEPVYLGGLSGCTYSEGVSWGKFVPPREGGRWVEVPADATIAWPFILKAVIERLEKEKT